MELKQIALDTLTVSPANMRVKGRSPDTANILPSVRARGVIVPLIVRAGEADGTYEIVAGIQPTGGPFHSWEHDRTSKRKAKRKGDRVYLAVSNRGDLTAHEGYLTLKEVRRAARVELASDKPVQPKASAPLRNYLDFHRYAASLAEVAGQGVAETNKAVTGNVKRGIISDCLTDSNGRAKVIGWVPRWLAFPAGSYARHAMVTLAASNPDAATIETDAEPRAQAA